MTEKSASPGVSPDERCAIGISFGNSYSSIASTIDDAPVVIANEDGGKIYWNTAQYLYRLADLSCNRSTNPHHPIICRWRRVHRKPSESHVGTQPKEHFDFLQGLPRSRVCLPISSIENNSLTSATDSSPLTLPTAMPLLIPKIRTDQSLSQSRTRLRVNHPPPFP